MGYFPPGIVEVVSKRVGVLAPRLPSVPTPLRPGFSRTPQPPAEEPLHPLTYGQLPRGGLSPDSPGTSSPGTGRLMLGASMSVWLWPAASQLWAGPTGVLTAWLLPPQQVTGTAWAARAAWAASAAPAAGRAPRAPTATAPASLLRTPRWVGGGGLLGPGLDPFSSPSPAPTASSPNKRHRLPVSSHCPLPERTRCLQDYSPHPWQVGREAGAWVGQERCRWGSRGPGTPASCHPECISLCPQRQPEPPPSGQLSLGGAALHPGCEA